MGQPPDGPGHFGGGRAAAAGGGGGDGAAEGAGGADAGVGLVVGCKARVHHPGELEWTS